MTDPAELVALPPLMERTAGSPAVTVAVIDGPVSVDHPALTGQRIQEIDAGSPATCRSLSSSACLHGTFVAGMLAAKRGSGAPAICPECSFLVRPIFSEAPSGNGDGPSATPSELAAAIIDSVRAGAHVVNLSAALAHPSSKGDSLLGEALDYAAKRGVLIVAAAGNQGIVGSSAITRHPWVIPVVASGLDGRPMAQSNLGSSIGRQGLSAPGESITSLGPNGKAETLSGTSAAAPFVTGAIGLLWSEFPAASPAEIKLAISPRDARRRNSVVPPLLNAWAAYQAITLAHWRKAS